MRVLTALDETWIIRLYLEYSDYSLREIKFEHNTLILSTRDDLNKLKKH